MDDATAPNRFRSVLVEGDDIVASWRPCVDAAFFSEVGFDAEELLIEAQRAFYIGHNEGNMGKSIGIDHDFISITAIKSGGAFKRTNCSFCSFCRSDCLTKGHSSRNQVAQ